MGKIDKGIKCSVRGCEKEAERSVGSNAMGLELKESQRRVYLCKEHYKQWKKLAKKERDIEKLRWK